MSEQKLTPQDHAALAASLGLDLTDPEATTVLGNLVALGNSLTLDDTYISDYARPLGGEELAQNDRYVSRHTVGYNEGRMISTDNATVVKKLAKIPAQDSVDPLCITTKDLTPTISNPEPNFMGYGHFPANVAPRFELKLKQCKAEAKLPTYGSAEAACFDIYAAEYATIPPEGTVAIGTGWMTEFKEGLELQIRSRSGMSLKGIVVANAPGTIDSDYRGEVKIILHNNNPQTVKHQGEIFENPDYVVSPGDRIAQGVMQPVVKTSFAVVQETSVTDRGDKGLGHTGI